MALARRLISSHDRDESKMMCGMSDIDRPLQYRIQDDEVLNLLCPRSVWSSRQVCKIAGQVSEDRHAMMPTAYWAEKLSTAPRINHTMHAHRTPGSTWQPSDMKCAINLTTF